MKNWCVLLGFLLLSSKVCAGEVEVVRVLFEAHGDNWTVHTTLKHADSGWDHYANAWRVVDENGKVLGTRTLWHPHEHEQPFTRSLGDVHIPAGSQRVIVEAQDSVHGWSPQRVIVDLRKSKGERFEVRR